MVARMETLQEGEYMSRKVQTLHEVSYSASERFSGSLTLEGFFHMGIR